MEFLQDAHNWVAFSFCMFAVVAFVLGRKPILAALDGRIVTIRKDIDTAERLRDEAQQLLSNFTAKHQDATEEAGRILAEGRQHAAEIRRQGMQELDETMTRREQMLKERLGRMKEDAVHEIQAYAADLIVKATAGIIGNHMDEGANARLVEQSAGQLAGRL